MKPFIGMGYGLNKLIFGITGTEEPKYIAVSVHQNINTTKAIVTNDDSKALTQDKLTQLITDTRVLLKELCESNVSNDELVLKCEDLLAKSSLNPELLITEYLVPFAEN
jgi:hypothetical protein